MKCKILIGRQNNKNIYCGDKMMGKKRYCAKCSEMKGCGKRFTHSFLGDRICGRFEDLKHSDHYIYCEDCTKKISEVKA